jgi:hypothetical protein
MILALIQPTKLIRLSTKLRDKVLAAVPSKAGDIANDPNLDMDMEPSDHFSTLQRTLRTLEDFFEDDETATDLLAEAVDGIDYAIKMVEKKKEEKEEEERDKARWEEEEASHWERQAPARPATVLSDYFRKPPNGVRSIFSDVDE